MASEELNDTYRGPDAQRPHAETPDRPVLIEAQPRTRGTFVRESSCQKTSPTLGVGRFYRDGS